MVLSLKVNQKSNTKKKNLKWTKTVPTLQKLMVKTNRTLYSRNSYIQVGYIQAILFRR